MPTPIARRLAWLQVVLASALLSGCAATVPDPADPAVARAVLDELNRYDDADLAFVEGMLPHHEQGVELAHLARDRARTGGVRDLAARIDRAQGAEVDQLRGYLTGWGRSTDGAHAMSMPGMVGPDVMTRLRDGDAGSFDRLWLQAMTAHHRGAVAMARTELDRGVHQGVRNLARNVIAVQEREIAVMADLAR